VGSEARLPFLDHRLAEAVLSTSVYTKLNQGYSKSCLRQAMNDALPREICWQRKKRGFETPARNWFMTGLAPHMLRLFSERDSGLDELVDTRRLLGQYHAFLGGDPGTLTHFDWFKLLTTSIWLKQLTASSTTLDSLATHTGVVPAAMLEPN